VDRIHAENYRSWARAPGYETRRASNAAHGDAVDIYVDDTVTIALGVPGILVWPVGSLIVKDGFNNGDFDLVAAMEKRGNGWFGSNGIPKARRRIRGNRPDASIATRVATIR